MSLMDTIKGARQEAEESGIPFEKPTFRKKDDGNEAAGASEGSSSQGFTRRSAAKAKPSRQAAAGVQVVRTSGGSKTRNARPNASTTARLAICATTLPSRYWRSARTISVRTRCGGSSS